MTTKPKVEWNLNLILPEKDSEKEKERVTSESYVFINKWKDREDYLSDPKILAEALSEYEAWEETTGLTGALGFLRSLETSLDQANAENKAKLNQIIDLGNKIQNDIQFFEHRVSKIPEAVQQQLVKDPELKHFWRFLKRLWLEAKFLLSEPEEKIMNLKANSSYGAWERMTAGIISKEEREVLGEKKNFSEIYNLINDTDKKTRDAAASAMNDILARWTIVGEAEMNAILNDKKVNDELRGFKRADEARHISDDVTSSMVDALTKAVSENFDIPARFYELKAKLVGVSKLEYYERSVPYGRIDQKYDYLDAAKLVTGVFKGLDPVFAEIFERLNTSGQVDVFPKKGKRGGAFCAHDLKSLPTFVLLNYDGKLDDVLTLAHEFGHAINDELMQAQTPFYFHTSLATAEVASTFFEGLVLKELLNQADEETRLALMVKKMDDDVGTIFRQVAMYEFEKELHTKFREKGYLAKEEIGEMWIKHAVSSMGPAINKTPGSENWWLYVPHIRDFFYVYSYASGQLISEAMRAEVVKDKKFVAKVKQFLSSGSSKAPVELFLDMGIDVTKPVFWQEGLLEIKKRLMEIETLAKKLGKI